MNYFIFLSLVIAIAGGIPDSDLPLFDYESYEYDYRAIGGVSEFPLIDSVSFFRFFLFVFCMCFPDFYLLLPLVSLDGLLW